MINKTIDESDGKYQVLLLHQQTQTVKIEGHGEHVLVTAKSRHSRSSLVHPDNDQTALASILFFAKCFAVNSSDSKQVSLWVAAVSWYDHHPCKLWFGKPTEVWSTTNVTDPMSFILINSRVVYVKTDVDFGSILGSSLVYLIVPLDL